jgi:hypothetical protein
MPIEARHDEVNQWTRKSNASWSACALMVLAPAERQLHLAVRTGDGFVHASAGIRRVVETPGEPQWPLIAAYRKRRSR